MATLVLTALGDDQTGLVDALAQVIGDHGGNWEQSHMAQLAGKFAGIVVATVADSRAEELIAALEPLERRGLLDIAVEIAEERVVDAARAVFSIDLVGQDRAGIIRHLAHGLAEIGASIDELSTETRDAPMAGGLLFEAHAYVTGPPSLTTHAIEDAIAELGTDFQVDVTAI